MSGPTTEFRGARASRKSRVGRPPKGRRAMTDAQRAKAYRRRKSARGKREAARKARDEAERRTVERWRASAAGRAAIEAADRHWHSLEWRRAMDWLESLNLGENLADIRRIAGDERFTSWLRREFLESAAAEVRDSARLIADVLNERRASGTE